MARGIWIGEGRDAELKEVYGDGGIWRVLLGRAAGYLGTEVKCESISERHYRVLDFWTSHVQFEAFREGFAAECVAFDRLLFAAGLLQKEEWLGAFYTGESD